MSQSLNRIASESREDLLRNIDELRGALEKIKQGAAEESMDQLGGLRQRLEQVWDNMDLGERYSQLADRTKQAGRVVYDEAREHPMASVFVGLGLVALVGWLVTRR